MTSLKNEQEAFRDAVQGLGEIGRILLEQTGEWPDAWKGEERDVDLGREIVVALLPFLKSVGSGQLAERTVRRHFVNAWILGGEIVRYAYTDGAVRKARGSELLCQFVDDDGGPLFSSYASEEEQRSFDSTCRKLFRFLEKRS